MFQRERLTDRFFSEARGLIDMNYQETGLCPSIRFSPQKDMYLAAQSAGLLRLYTARDGQRLIGYNTFIVSVSMQYGRAFAMQDALFVAPDFRGRAAIKFIRWVDDEIYNSERVAGIIRQSTESRPIDRLLSRMGYGPKERVYLKEVPDGY